jgi:hypothetical protein
MAIDTRDKRGSCISIAGPYRIILPNPDAGAEDQADRQQMAYAYRGILATGAGGFQAAWAHGRNTVIYA